VTASRQQIPESGFTTASYATELCHNIGGPRDLGATVTEPVIVRT